MTMFLKALPYLIAAALLAGALWGINAWDKGRLESAYQGGVKDERARWELARANAIAAAASDAQGDTRASEAATAKARTQTTAAGAATAAQTQSSVEEITNAYAKSDLPACLPDGRPVQLPASVLRGLDQARRSALRDP